VNGPDVDAVIQVGTNLAMARLAGIAEFWLDKPVLLGAPIQRNYLVLLD